MGFKSEFIIQLYAKVFILSDPFDVGSHQGSDIYSIKISISLTV